jgi:hypothetical protein
VLPPSLTYLVRPFSVSQGYGLVLRMMALLQDSDVRVVHVEPGAAVIQWHAGKDTSHVPDSLEATGHLWHLPGPAGCARPDPAHRRRAAGGQGPGAALHPEGRRLL